MTTPLVVACRDTPKPFQPADRTLDPVALGVHNLVVAGWVPLVALRWDDGSDSTAPQLLAGDAIAVSSIADKLLGAVLGPPYAWSLHPSSVQKWQEAEHLVALTASEMEGERLASPFALEVYLGAEPTS